MKLLILIFSFLLLFSSPIISNVLWADKVVGFSSHTSNKENSCYQILGKPNLMPGFGASACAWMPKFPSRKIEWIRIKFITPIFIKQIAINENQNAGAIIKVMVYDSLDNGHVVYSNNAPNKTEPTDLFRIFPDNLDFRSDNIRIEINTAIFEDYYQIDAVGISDDISPISTFIKLNEDNDLEIVKENLGKNINSQYRELAPIISADGKSLYFTRDGHPANFGPFKKQDVWFSKMSEEGIFNDAKNIGTPINDDNVNFAVSLSTDGNQLFLGNIYLPGGEYKRGFSLSTYDGENWTFPDSIKIKNYYNFFDKGSYNLSSNGKILLMAIKRDDSFGRTDLYISFLSDDNQWSEPMNLGNSINTADEEVSPFLASDNRTLYFSTSGYPGYGQSDMFLAKRLDDTWLNWSEPINLGPNINTSGWDAYYSITAAGDYAYFVSSANSLGLEDIFRVKLPNSVKPESVVLVKGKVLNSKTNLPIKSNIKFEALPEGYEVGRAISNQLNGDYQIVLPGGKKYGFRAEADGYISINQFINLENLGEYSEQTVNLSLAPIEKGVQFRMNNIFFEIGKWDLLADSFAELNRLVDFLMKNQSIVIKINGHTDNIGNDKANVILSQKRAESVKEFLMKHNIDSSRIKTKGFGKSKPIESNDTEEGRQLNRRVEFEIVT